MLEGKKQFILLAKFYFNKKILELIENKTHTPGLRTTTWAICALSYQFPNQNFFAFHLKTKPNNFDRRGGFHGNPCCRELPTSSRTTARARREARALEAGCRPCATALSGSLLPVRVSQHGESRTPFNNFCWLWLTSAGRFTVRVKARRQHAGSWGVRTNFTSLRRAR